MKDARNAGAARQGHVETNVTSSDDEGSSMGFIVDGSSYTGAAVVIAGGN